MLSHANRNDLFHLCVKCLIGKVSDEYICQIVLKIVFSFIMT